jgi:hypothetical protein
MKKTELKRIKTDIAANTGQMYLARLLLLTLALIWASTIIQTLLEIDLIRCLYEWVSTAFASLHLVIVVHFPFIR